MVNNKMLVAFAAIALLASTVEASIMLEKFENFLKDMTLDNAIIMISFQLWGFLGPLLAGPLDIILYYLWSEAGFTLVVDGGTNITLKFFELFGLSGIGEYQMLFDLIFDAAPKILVNQLISAESKIPYGNNFDNLQTTLKFDI